MKKVFLLAIVCIAFSSLSAQEFPKMDASPMDAAYFPVRATYRAFAKTEEEKKAAEPQIRVLYSRPQAKGRDVFPGLQKYGEVWRVGANESTEIMFFNDVKVNGSTVKAGRYTMYIVPQEKEWEVHISTDLDGWGQYAFDPARSTIAKITVPTEKTAATVEALSILFEAKDPGAHMIIAWDDTMVRVPIEI
ncbi:MAG: DUF2911 domain-containing protein [Bacteroidota bacterium]